MSECKWYPFCPMKRYYEMGKLDERWIRDYCRGQWRNCVRYKLEEAGTAHPDYMLPDGKCDQTLKQLNNSASKLV